MTANSFRIKVTDYPLANPEIVPGKMNLKIGDTFRKEFSWSRSM